MPKVFNSLRNKVNKIELVATIEDKKTKGVTSHYLELGSKKLIRSHMHRVKQMEFLGEAQKTKILCKLAHQRSRLFTLLSQIGRKAT